MVTLKGCSFFSTNLARGGVRFTVGQEVHGGARKQGKEEVIPEPRPTTNLEEKSPDVQPLRSARVRKPVERLITTM